MTKKNIEAIYPLSPMQQGMLFHSLYAPESGTYFEQMTCILRGRMDVPAFKRAWQQVVQRHPILRTAFAWKSLDKMLQIVYKQVELPLEQLDWRDLSSGEQKVRLETYIQTQRSRGFDMSKAPLMRLALIQIADDAHQFVWSLHHTLLDGWSMPLLMKEVLAFYEAFSRSEELYLKPARPYRDYITWIQKQDLVKAQDYWTRKLCGFYAPTALFVERPYKTGSENEGHYEERETTLSAETTAALRALAQKQQMTLNTLVQGAWGLLLSRYSGEEDVVFGATVSGRPADLPGVETMIGLFINTLPVRLQITAETSLLDWLKGIQAQSAEMRQYEYSPLVNIREWSDVPPGKPLFESILVFENYPVGDSLKEQKGSLEIGEVRSLEQTNYPLTLVTGPEETMTLKISFTCRRFDPETVQRMLSHLKTLLENFPAYLERPLVELSILTEVEKHQLLVDWNRTQTAYPQTSIQQLFEAQAEKSPNALAVSFGAETLTYWELNQRANQLAHYLQGWGIGPDVLVGICVERSPEMVVGILGILKAGGAYLPMDPKYPAERLGFMLEDTRVPVLLTQESLLSIFNFPLPTSHLLCLDRDWPVISQENTENPLCNLAPENLAYVIYTSGSTGTPKGVMISHQSLANHAQALADILELDSGDHVMQFISLSFDAAAEEIFPTIIRGARLDLPGPSTELTGRDILYFCEQHQISVLHLPVSFWHQSVDEMLAEEIPMPSALKVLLVGGESPDLSRLRAWSERVDHPMDFINAYGPTETTITTTLYRIPCSTAALSDLSRVPIGRPIPNVQTYILDRNFHPVPAGMPGELYVGGAGLALGYLNQPELTAEKFVRNPFINEEVRTQKAEYRGQNTESHSSFILNRSEFLYRTGDLARYLPDGNIEFLGRVDHQVKLRGFRIELGEIETTLRSYSGLCGAVVAMREDTPGDKRLVAYLVPDGKDLSATELRSYLKDRLPDYMIPSVFVALEALPLLPNGKIDRRSLPTPENGRLQDEGEYLTPRNAVEEILAGIFADVLSLKQVGLEDNFFDLGGHSLLATQLLSRIRGAFGVELPLRSLFESPTVAGVASLLYAAIASRDGVAAPSIQPASRDQDLPLSFAQQRLWFLDQLEPGNLFYNIPSAVRISGSLDVNVLERSLNEIMRRHEVLRTSFIAQDGKPVQVIAPHLTITIPVTDLRHLPDSEQGGEIRRRIRQEAQQPFDLSAAPLFRVRLLQLGEEDYVVLLTMHHIVSDGWSMGVLVDELARLYQAFHNGADSPLADLSLQYADYAAWQRGWLQGEVLQRQIDYWKEQLAGASPLLELPTDHPRPAVKTSNGSTIPFDVDSETMQALKALSRKEGVTLYMTLLSVFQTLLYRYSGQEDVNVGTVIANRQQAEVEGLIGFFVNTLVMRTDLSGEPSFLALLKRVREVTLGAYAHQDVPFEMLVETLQPKRDLSHTPLFQVGFTLQNMPVRPIKFPDLSLEPLEAHGGTAAFDLLMSVSEVPGGLHGSLEYNTDLFEVETIQRMVGHFQTLLAGVAADPQLPITRLPLLTDAERELMLTSWNQTEEETPADRCAHQLFEAQVAQRPDALAVIFEDQALTYQELNRRANRLAHYLRKLGVGPEVLVGISTERSPEMVVGILGILKAGGAYLPVDPNYPPERIAFMLVDSQVPVLLTQARLLDQLPLHSSTSPLPVSISHIVCLDRDWPTISQECAENPSCNVTSENLAYLIYTSGSTGKPKGTLLRHRGLSNLTAAQKKAFGIRESSRVLQFSPLSFDASVWETFMALANGAALCLGRQEVLASTSELTRLLREKRITNATLPPSVLRVLPAVDLPDLQTVIAAGEACTPDLVARWAPGRDFFNAYGPTETTVCASMYHCDELDPEPPPIGRPIANTRLYILDSHGQPVPIGVPGELYVGGVGVARGYLNQPELTAEKFVPNPFVNAEFRMQNAEYHSSFSTYHSEFLYRTGDLVRYRPDGNIEFLGRIDQQVKVRGFRIELGEIESALGKHPELKEAVVITREDVPGDKRLVAYIVPDSASTPNLAELRNFVRQSLPEYMVPSVFVVMEALPLIPNGKVNRRALPAPDAARPELESVYVPPRSEVERELAEISAELLGIERVGVLDNFFELGGHSLLATQFISRVRDTFQVELPLRTLFESPTVAALAEIVEKSKKPADRTRIAEMLARINELSPEEVKQLLELKRAKLPVGADNE